MARTRNIKPGFFTNEALAETPSLARLLFAGLPTIADREGRLEDRPKRIKTLLLPYDDCDVDGLLTDLSRGDDPFIVRYRVDGKSYIQIVKFLDHQTPHHTEKASVIPEHSEDSKTTPSLIQPPIKEEGTRRKVIQKGDARGKVPQISAADVPVPDGFETPEVRQAISDWLVFKTKRGESYKDAGYFGRKVAEFARAGPAAFIAAVNSSIGNNYSGIFPTRNTNGHNTATSSRVGPGQRYRGD